MLSFNKFDQSEIIGALKKYEGFIEIIFYSQAEQYVLVDFEERKKNNSILGGVIVMLKVRVSQFLKFQDFK